MASQYGVDIEIALRGSQKITELTKSVKALNKEVNEINKQSKLLGKELDKSFRVDSIQNYSKALNMAERALRNVASGTDAERRALERVVRIRQENNRALARQNILLKQASADPRRITDAGFGVQGPALPKDFFTPQGPKLPPGFTEAGRKPKKGATPPSRADRIGAAVSAGAFPLLFGGGPGMAAGGAIGGFAAGATFGPAAIALQVLGGALDDAAAKQKQLGLALKEGKGVVTAYEQAVARLSSAKREYLQNLEESGQKQKLFEETVKQAEEDLGFFGKILIANAQNAGKFDRAVQLLTNSLKALAVAAATPAFLQPTPEKPQKNLQDALSQAAKDRVNAAREELAALNLNLQAKQSQLAVEEKLNERNIENLAAAQTAVVVAEKEDAISQARSDKMKGLITKFEEEEQVKQANIKAALKLLGIEKQRTDNAERLRQKNAQIAREAADEANRQAVRAAQKAQEDTDLLKSKETLFAQLSIQQLDQEIKRKDIFQGQEAALQHALEISDKRLAQEQTLLAVENSALQATFVGTEHEEAINHMIEVRKFNLEESNRVRKMDISDAIRQLQIEKDLNDLQAKQETRDLSTGLTRQISDVSSRIATPFGTDETEMLELRIAQIRRTEDAQRELNDQIDAQNIILAKSNDPKVLKRAAEQKQILEDRIALNEKLLPQLDELEQKELKQKQALEKIVPVTDALTDSVLSVVEGTKTAEEAFADFLRNVASMLMDAAKQMISTYIAIGVAKMFAGMGGGVTEGAGSSMKVITEKYGNFGAQGAANAAATLPAVPKALGGAVGAGQPYLVGEKGPELFVPGAQGNIVPNNAMGGSNIVVNVDASGSSVEGDAQQSKALGQALGAAVKAELIKQKMPGGLLA